VEDAEFYRQLLKEFLETIDPASSGIVKKNILESLDMKPPLAIVMSNNSSVKRLFLYSEISIFAIGRGGFLRDEEVPDEEEESCGSTCLKEQKDQVNKTHIVSPLGGFLFP
jgi:hypothetical protein